LSLWFNKTFKVLKTLTYETNNSLGFSKFNHFAYCQIAELVLTDYQNETAIFKKTPTLTFTN